jgi:hypothetical protein
MTTNGDGRLASAFLILATGVGAVMLVEQLHSGPRARRTDFGQPLLAAPLAASALSGVIDRTYAGEASDGVTATRREAARHATAFRLLPGGELCQ